MYYQCVLYKSQRFISVYCQFVFLYSVYNRMCYQCSLCKPQRFIPVYCQFVFLSGVCATTDVGRTFRREFILVREVRTTAVSRRLRKTNRCFYSVFVKAHPVVCFYRFLFLSISNKYSNPNTNVSLLASPYRKSSKLVNED